MMSMAGFSLDLGRVFGINIELHWTFVLLLVIAALYGPVLFLFIVVLFILVVIHELAHSITSRNSGIRVKKIVLLPLGGASIVDLDDASPDTAFRIALAGPLTSILLALVFGILAAYFVSPPLRQAMQLLFLINVILGVFNLLPAFPLDGGRVLKSYLERKHGQLEATKIAVTWSKVILVLFVLGSIVYAYMVSYSGNDLIFLLLWNFVIVIFIYGGAQAELESAYVMAYTSNIPAYKAMSSNFAIVRPTSKMRDVYRVLLNKGTHIILFREDGIIKQVSRTNYPPASRGMAQMLDLPVTSYSVEIPVIRYDAPLSKAIDKMRYEEVSVAAVLKGRKLVGVLNNQHIESIIALHMAQEIKKSQAKEKSGLRDEKQELKL